MGVILNGEVEASVITGSIQGSSTKYWSNNTEQFYTINDLVPGYKSAIDISLANYYSKSIAATLVYGLSLHGGPIKIVGATQLDLITGGTFAVYKTALITAVDTPLALKGDLVVVLYDSANQVLDTFNTKVDSWSERMGFAMMPVLMLLLRPPVDPLLNIN
ncbi:MAG: hypothetical protein KJ804_22195 [Proteobacteria bacterium]|nr:hypothetical protein [Pseudomonadota bacterium]MBU1061021.1 hypothetical protein [Pseudomonadota bacterium]